MGFNVELKEWLTTLSNGEKGIIKHIETLKGDQAIARSIIYLSSVLTAIAVLFVTETDRSKS